MERTLTEIQRRVFLVIKVSGNAHPQSLQCAPKRGCAGGFSWIGYLNSDRYGNRLVPCVQRPFRSLHFGDGDLMGGAVAEAWRSVLRRDKGGRLGRDAFRVGSPRRLSNGQKRASAHSMRPAKTRPLSPCSALHTSTAMPSPSRSTPPLRSLHYRVRPPLRTPSVMFSLMPTPLDASAL